MCVQRRRRQKRAMYSRPRTFAYRKARNRELARLEALDAQATEKAKATEYEERRAALEAAADAKTAKNRAKRQAKKDKRKRKREEGDEPAPAPS